MDATFITYKDLKELLKDFQLLHEGKHDDEEEIEYDADSKFIGVGPWEGPVRVFNNWEAAVDYMRKQDRETYLGVFKLEWNASPDKTIYPVRTNTLYPYAVINQGIKPQPINPKRKGK